MNDTIIVGGDSGVRVIGSPLYLEVEALAQRITALDGSTLMPQKYSQQNESFPAIHFFTIPKYLLEVLWLEEIPKMAGLPDLEYGMARNSEAWMGLEALGVLLETVDSRFVKPINAIYQSSPRSRSGCVCSSRDICDQALKSAQNTIESGDWKRAAWLNLDDHSHSAHVCLREPKGGLEHGKPAIKLEIAKGEGILWQRRPLLVTEVDSNKTEASNRLILLSGREP